MSETQSCAYCGAKAGQQCHGYGITAGVSRHAVRHQAPTDGERLAAVERQRDALLSASEALIAWHDGTAAGLGFLAAIHLARQAVAAVRGA